jgi:TP53 regulating kinase and related kinases
VTLLNTIASQKFKNVMGAEAKVEMVNWYGKDAIMKRRERKLYRIADLDNSLRSRRTKEEAEIMYASKKAGVDCPQIYFVDPNECEIIMEFIEGWLLKNSVEEESEVFNAVGRYAGMLHDNGIIHGDLTTKNIILSENRIALIDFGLAFYSDRIEDRAEDLHLLKQVLRSTDPLKLSNSKFHDAMVGYGQITGTRNKLSVIKQIGKIELRGRYAQVD